MTTPIIPEGRLMAAAAKKGATWGTAVALGANDGILIEEDGGIKPTRPYLPGKESDSPYVQVGTLGPMEAVDFTPTGTFRYEGGALQLIMAMLFGTAGTPTDLTGAYEHTFQWKDSLSGMFGTFAIERRGKIWEVTSFKPMSLEFSISDGLLKFALGLRGNQVIDTSTVNQDTQMDAITYASRVTRAEFKECGVFMNKFADPDVDNSTYELECSEFTLTYSRSPDAVPVAGDDYIIEPLEEDWPAAVLEMSFPRMNAVNAAYFKDFSDQDLKKVLLKFTGALISGSNYFSLKCFLPNMRIVDVDFPHGPIIPGSIQLQAEECTTAPTGMDYERPYIEIVNEMATDYLA